VAKPLRIKDFKPEMPGSFVSLASGDQAFLPNPLPPEWEFPTRLWPMISEAKRLIGILDGIGRVLPNPAILLPPTEDREAIQSSALEGTYATPRELLLFELEPEQREDEPDTVNRFREVYNYRLAIQHAVASQLPICQRLMRELHKILLEGVRGQHTDPGHFRRIQVAIGTNKRFIPPPPQNLPKCLDELEVYINQESSFDPLIDCFLVHYQFETIHPFVDGNGRIGRLILALMIQRKCHLTKPWLYLSDYFEQHRDDYIQGLYQVSTLGNWEKWIEFSLQATIEQARSTIVRCESLLAIREQFRQRLNETGGHVRLHTIIDQIFITPMIRVTDAQSILQVTYPTAKSDLEKLVKAGILQKLNDSPAITYYAPEIFKVAYDDISSNNDKEI
jgi:Fic family protein